MMGLDNSAVESPSPVHSHGAGRESVLTIVKEIIEDLRYGQQSASGKDVSTLQRYREVIARKGPRMNRSVKFLSADLVQWMNRGGPWRAFLILSTGIITSIGLTGVFIFLLFLITATVNTVIVALLGSLAAVGAVATLFFAALTAIYVGILTIAACVISTIAFFTIVAVATTTGWIAFWWVVFLGVKKFFQVAQGTLGLRGSSVQTVG